jgi:hypothetical protein
MPVIQEGDSINPEDMLRRDTRIRTVAASILNKQSRTADKEWSSSLGVERGADNPSL